MFLWSIFVEGIFVKIVLIVFKLFSPSVSLSEWLYPPWWRKWCHFFLSEEIEVLIIHYIYFKDAAHSHDISSFRGIIPLHSLFFSYMAIIRSTNTFVNVAPNHCPSKASYTVAFIFLVSINLFCSNLSRSLSIIVSEIIEKNTRERRSLEKVIVIVISNKNCVYKSKLVVVRLVGGKKNVLT